MTSNTGAVVSTFTKTLSTGTQVISVSEPLAKGIYYIKMITKEGVIVRKHIVE
ncbi:MAG: T9SS type A sorting domain-containing protein [Flavobacteriales bacterium]